MAAPADTLPGGREVAPSARFGGFAYGWEVGLLVVMALLYLLGTTINPRFFGDLTALQSVLSLWGNDIDEKAFRGLTGTNAQVGTFVRGPRSPGFTHRVNGHHERLKTGEPDDRRPRDVAP